MHSAGVTKRYVVQHQNRGADHTTQSSHSARALRLRRRWLGSQRRSAARSARCSSRLAAQERGARLGGMFFSVPFVLVSTGHRVTKPAQPSLLRRRARPSAGPTVSPPLPSWAGRKERTKGRPAASRTIPYQVSYLPVFLPSVGPASPSPLPGRSSPSRSPTGSARTPLPTQPPSHDSSAPQAGRVAIRKKIRSARQRSLRGKGRSGRIPVSVLAFAPCPSRPGQPGR